MTFTHLHLHTPYSLLDGFCRIDRLMEAVKARGMDAVAITDHGNLFGAIQFYKAARAAGVKPIIGCEVYVTPDRFDRKDRTRYHLILLAENTVGYHNLMKIVSAGWTEGFYYKPRVDFSVLQAHAEGIIALSACLAGEIPRRILDSEEETVRETIQKYLSIFDRDHFFLEIQDHQLREEKMVARTLVRLSQEMGIGLVATNDCHYIEKTDASAHDVLLCIQTGATLHQEKRMRFPNEEFDLKSPEEMRERFANYPEAIANTEKIAARCQVEIPFHELHLPHFEVPFGETNASYLRRLVTEGLDRRYPKEKDANLRMQAEKRAEKELRVIEDMGYVDYFLIVSDFVQYAKAHGVVVGPGRGSAAGSIISYCLTITDIDPLPYDLLFERFLNPERVSMPDIDIDFDDVRRETVIDYVKQKYGEDHVAQIVTFGTLAAKMAIRDVGRVMEMPLYQVDRIAKAVPNTLKITLDQALEESEAFRKLYEENEQQRQLIDFARAVEGLPRHTSTHAAGVLIAGEPVENLVPLSTNSGQITTQYNMTELEELGLLKMDFLGLRNLSVIRDALDMVEERTGKRPDLLAMDPEDPVVMEQFRRGETIGLFQFESPGMRRFLEQLRPERFEDLVAANALFRPGPMEQIPTYVEARHHPSHVHYLHPLLEPILKTTYGVIVYQEQVMQIVQQLAGYTLGGADNLRRAMSKKKMAVMEENREYFVYGRPATETDTAIRGCIANGIPAEVANQIYDQMIAFARYAFNKSHSVAYSYLAVETGYLKHYYPCEYFSALLTSVVGDYSKMSLYIREAERVGVKLLPPDVNHSEGKFSVENGKMRFGLMGIKYASKSLVETTVKARRRGGIFHSLDEYLRRLSDEEASALSRKGLESFIQAGACDSFGLPRAQLMADLEMTLSGVQTARRQNLAGQTSLFDQIQSAEAGQIKTQVPMKEYSMSQRLAYEKEVLGIYLSGHPFDPYVSTFAPYVNFTMEDLIMAEDPTAMDGRTIRYAGIVCAKRDLLTKKKESMCFLEVEDQTDRLHCVIFPHTFARVRDKIRMESPIFLVGTLQIREEESSLLVDEVKTVDEMPQGVLYIQMKSSDHQNYQQMKRILEKHRGNMPVTVYFSDRKQANRMAKDYACDGSRELCAELKTIFGSENVRISGQ